MNDAAPAQRKLSIDVFRGITIALMILVNNQGDWQHVFRPLRHAAWHGWLGADIVFPFFLFIMGVSISYSFSSRISLGERKIALALKILKRSAILIALGLAVNLIPLFDFTTMRIPGVLQRIGACYFFAAMVFLFFNKKAQWGTALVLLAGYGLLLKYVTPAGIGEVALSPRGNLCYLVDSYLLAGHTYEHAIVKGFDPEGILSTLPAVASTLLGAFAGDWLRTTGGARDHTQSARGRPGVLALTGAAAIALGAVLHAWIPINKNLWTPGYAVLMTGFALELLAFLAWCVDIRGARAWSKPFLVLGINAIAAYVLSSAAGRVLALVTVTTGAGRQVSIKNLVYTATFAQWLDPYTASLAYAAAFLLIWVGVMYVMYRKKIIIKI
jgi:predicted acyltransferase